MSAEQIIEAAASIALDSVPAGGSQYTDAIVQIFKANQGKNFQGKDIKKVFAEAGVELPNASNILFDLMKKGILTRPQTGWYTLA